MRPPITARPNGAFCSPPSPRPSAIGIMPIIIAVAVITTGRMRVNPACRAASNALSPRSTRSAGMQRRGADEGFKERLKIDHDQDVYENDGSDEAEQESVEVSLHRLYLTAYF